VDTDDLDRRVGQLEDDSRDHTAAIGDLQTIVMGPPPNRDNGIRGDLKALKTAYFQHKDDCRTKEGDVTTAKINLRGVYIMGFLQFLASILVALIASGALKP